jgi:cell division protein FtsL
MRANRKSQKSDETNAISAMSRPGASGWAPFVSVIFIVVTLLTVVFSKMEVRRIGYSLLVLSREEVRTKDESLRTQITLAKMNRLERVQSVAQTRLTMRRPELGQIIQMTDSGIALRQ